MKSITKGLDVEKVTHKMSFLFSTAEEEARETKFVQRKSPLTGLIFLQALVFGFMKHAKATLTQLAHECSRLGVEISAQGIDERINKEAVEFVKAMCLKAFEHFKSQQALPIAILKQFGKLYLLDSTYKELPAQMAEEYPGAGGKGSKASLKVQLVFEFIYGNLDQLVVEAGRNADQAFRPYLALL
jgi:hypothetical protein